MNLEWLERINRAMDYIEQNVTGEIDAKEIARLACCSEYHFPRIFSSMKGLTLSEYIRRRRLYSEWLPTSGYELADLPCIENYLAPDEYSPT
ncbi:hypothetical protein ACFDTO_34840 [Microbacteriaceae bacterium 4G12]